MSKTFETFLGALYMAPSMLQGKPKNSLSTVTPILIQSGHKTMANNDVPESSYGHWFCRDLSSTSVKTSLWTQSGPYKQSLLIFNTSCMWRRASACSAFPPHLKTPTCKLSWKRQCINGSSSKLPLHHPTSVNCENCCKRVECWNAWNDQTLFLLPYLEISYHI